MVLCDAGVAMLLAVSVAHKQLLVVQSQYNMTSSLLDEAVGRQPFSLSAKNKALLKQQDAVFALDRQMSVYNAARDGLRVACASE